MTAKIKFHYAGIVLISFIIAGLYLNSLNNSFHFDDSYQIIDNPYIKNLGDISLFLQGIKAHSTWHRMLPTLSFAINYHFNKLNPLGYHLVNLMLHLLSGILVYFISRVLLTLALRKTETTSQGNIGPENREIDLLSLFTAVIFVSHPIQVNTVTYIVQRNEGLAGLFYLLSFFLFLKGSFAAGRQRVLFFSGSGVSFLCSSLSKEIGLTLPVILILFDTLFICRGRKDLLRRMKFYLPLLFFLSAYLLFFLDGGLLRMFMKGSEGWRWTPWENLLTQANVIIQYFKLLLLPLPQWLNVDHDFWVSRTLFEYPTVLSVSIILFLLTLAAILIRKNKLISFSIFFFFIVLAPTSSLIPIWDVMVEYRLYLPIFAFALVLALMLHYLYRLSAHYGSKKLAQAVVVGISVFVLGFYSVVTIERNKVFKDELTLWTDAAKKSTNKERIKANLITAYNNLGVYYRRAGAYDKAIEILKTAIPIVGDNPLIYNNLGVAYIGKKDFDQAIAQFKQAIFYRPDYAKAHENLGKALAMNDLMDDAFQEIREAIRIDPAVPDYHFDLGGLYERRGLTDEAVKEYKEAVRLDSKFFEGHYRLGILYRKKNPLEAISEFEEAVKINPESGKAYFMLGIISIDAGYKHKAMSNFEKALQRTLTAKERKEAESILTQLRSLPAKRPQH